MKCITQPAVGLAMIALLLILSGCENQNPIEPQAIPGADAHSAGRELPEDSGAWQTVDLIWCGDGGGEFPEQLPTGQLRYHISQDLVFEGRIRARDLLPRYEYLLAIVGQPDLPGETEEYLQAGVVFYDDDAPYPYTGRPTIPGGVRGEQEYCDFLLVITDQHGGVQQDFSKVLPDGYYQVSFVVKDAHLWTHFAETGNFDTEVLCHDDVHFQITTQDNTWEQ
jgi:hypothetical protein